jgi:hypothetical protein
VVDAIFSAQVDAESVKVEGERTGVGGGEGRYGCLRGWLRWWWAVVVGCGGNIKSGVADKASLDWIGSKRLRSSRARARAKKNTVTPTPTTSTTPGHSSPFHQL